MDDDARLDRPIILLGFHRSGTTLLGRIFDRHPDVAYWSEPRHVWMHSFPYRRYDVLGGVDARPAVARRIRTEFARFTDAEGGSRFAEKTPSNMVRLPFIREVLPGCKIIHIIRDGRACTYSTLDVLRRPTSTEGIKRRARAVPWWHYPSYVLKAWRNVLVPRITGRAIPYWGPRIPGLRDRVRELPQDEMCAWQWQETMRIARRDATLFGEDQYREWRYEALVADPVPVIREMFDFCDLEVPEGLETWLTDHVNTGSLGKWRDNFDEDTVRRVTARLEPLLSELGYA